MKLSSGLLAASLVTMLVAWSSGAAAAQDHTRVKTPAVPGEQAPPASPGQNNFGGPIPAPGRGGQRPPIRPPRQEPALGTVSLDQISMSDPFIYPDEQSHTYYLTGTGGRLYKSQDLKMWTGPYSVIDLKGTWMDGHFVAAAEIHHIGGKALSGGHVERSQPSDREHPATLQRADQSDTAAGRRRT